MNIRPATYDHKIQRGDDFSFTFDIEVDGTVLVLSGCTVLSQIREKEDQSATLIEDFTVAVNGSNEITLSLTDVQTAAITQSVGYYDVLVVNAANDDTHYVKGTITFSSTVTVPTPSTVTLTSPTDGASYAAPATVSLAATAVAGAGRTVSKVEFYNGTTLLNSDSAAPYAYSWTGVVAGTYTITARVYDDKSNYDSDSVEITVA